MCWKGQLLITCLTQKIDFQSHHFPIHTDGEDFAIHKAKSERQHTL